MTDLVVPGMVQCHALVTQVGVKGSQRLDVVAGAQRDVAQAGAAARRTGAEALITLDGRDSKRLRVQATLV